MNATVPTPDDGSRYTQAESDRISPRRSELSVSGPVERRVLFRKRY